MVNEKTQLTSASGYDTARLRFSKPIAGTIPNSTPAINYKRINITTLNEDGTEGGLIIPTEKCFSFGVGENINPETGLPSGYSFPICLYNRDGATKAEKEWVETFERIVEAAKKHLIKNREEIDKYDLEMAELKKLNPLYWKRDKVTKQLIKDAGPTLYAKLLSSKKSEKIVTNFYDLETGDSIDALSLIGKYCTAVAAIKIESIFIGNKISLQVKLYECDVKPLLSSMPRLLAAPAPRPEADTKVKEGGGEGGAPPLDDSDDEGSLPDEDEAPKSPPKPAAPAKRPLAKRVPAKKAV